MAIHPDSLSVLVVDGTPEILIFLARVLGRKNIRALLARDSQAAIEIAQRDYLPIDLVLTDVIMPEPGAAKLMNRLLQIRPGVRVLYMSARLDLGAIRIRLMPEGAGAFFSLERTLAERGDLIASIRSAAGVHRYSFSLAVQ